MDVNNTILFPNNVDPKNRAGQDIATDVAKKPAVNKQTIQSPTDENKIPNSLELAKRTKQAQQLAQDGIVLDRGSLVNFLV